MGEHTTTSTDDRVRATGELIDGRYRILDSLGRGGMGHVYRAEHVRIRRPCALKLLRAEFRDLHGFRARFEREAFASGQLRHPNCVQITDSGTLEDGTAFLVMELLEGRSLDTVIETERRVPWQRALRIARHVLRGLAHAHAAGVVHRDIKPENVFLVRHGDDPEFAKILDFGIAKLVDEAAGENREQLTETGIAIGSPRYMSPEQAMGGTLDARSDVYSVSVLLFELITGRQPFNAEHPLEIVKMHLGTPPPAFAEVAPDLNVPREVEAMVRRGLAKAPAERFASADEYVAAIDRLLAAPPPRAPAPTGTGATMASTPRAMGRRLRLTPRALWIAAGALLLLVIALAAALSGDGPAVGETDVDVGELAPDQLAPDELDMPAVVLERGVPDEAIAETPELAEVQDLMRAGKTGAAHGRLKRMRREHRDDPHYHYLLGNVYMDKRWWQDGFESYQTAIAGHEDYRKDPVLIRNAIRNFSSPSQGWRGERFLTREIGDAALPFLDDAAKNSGSRRVRERAARLAAKLRSR